MNQELHLYMRGLVHALENWSGIIKSQVITVCVTGDNSFSCKSVTRDCISRKSDFRVKKYEFGGGLFL